MVRRKKPHGCRCRRVQRRLSPKVPGSLCHFVGSVGDYHPCVRERIEGKRVVRAWLVAVDRDDVTA
jgi:hypothetical protein